MAFRSARWTFSTRATSRASRSVSLRTSAGIWESPALSAARNLRSPATSSYPSAVGRTRTGCSTPFARIEATSSASASGGKDFLGCRLPVRTFSSGTSRTADSGESGAPGEGASSADSPLPRTFLLHRVGFAFHRLTTSRASSR